MPINTVDQLITAFPGQFWHFNKTSVTAKAAGSYQSLWTAAGQPGAGAAAGSTTGVIPTSATAGSFPFTNPTSPALSYMNRLAAATSGTGTLVIYDRLYHNSGLVGNVATAQTFSQPALTRPDSLGNDTELWLEIYTPTGGTAVTATASYTNQSGTAAKSATAALIATPVAGQMIPFTLAAGDTGVRSVQSVTLSVTTGTAGNFGITIIRRLAEIGLTLANIADWLDTFSGGMPRIYDSACIALLVLANATTTGNFFGDFQIVQG